MTTKQLEVLQALSGGPLPSTNVATSASAVNGRAAASLEREGLVARNGDGLYELRARGVAALANDGDVRFVERQDVSLFDQSGLPVHVDMTLPDGGHFTDEQLLGARTVADHLSTSGEVRDVRHVAALLYALIRDLEHRNAGG